MSKRNRTGPPGANWWDKKKPVKDKTQCKLTTTYNFDGVIDEITLDISPTSHIEAGDSIAADDGTVFRVINKTATSITLAPTGKSIGRFASSML